MTRLADLSGVELRLELAEAEAERPRTVKGVCFRRSRIRAVTAELVSRGCF